jgi:threonine dehydrogenase-like Zn-dependent dehydrogenase
VIFAGICGSDVKTFGWDIALGSKIQPPVVPGHEGVGKVVEVGPGVANVKVGDIVAAETSVTACGLCRFCRSGRLNMCLDRAGLGSRANGYFAEYTIARSLACHVIPEHVDPKAAAVLEPLACAVNGVILRSRVVPGDVVVVWGPGSIGQCAAQVARRNGAYVVMVGTPHSRHRLDVARRLGADRILVAGEDDVVAEVMKLTGGYGADVCFEAVGSEAALTEALKCVRKLGQLVVLATSGAPYSMDIRTLFMREITMIGAVSTDPHSWDISLSLLEKGFVDLSSLVSHVLPLDRWQEGIKKGKEREGLKVLLVP